MTDAGSSFSVLGVLSWEVRDLSGNLVSSGRSKNLVVNSGLNLIRDMVGGDFYKAPTHLWLGTGSAAVDATDTTSTLTAPYKKAITARTRADKNVAIQTFIGTGEGNGVTYREAGLVNSFDEVSVLFARVLITPIVKTSSVTVTFTWNITLAAV